VASQLARDAVCFDVEDDYDAIVLGRLLEGGQKGRNWDLLGRTQADRRGG
jgi:hypothetical protein